MKGTSGIEEEDTYTYIMRRRMLTYMKGTSGIEEEDTYTYIMRRRMLTYMKGTRPTLSPFQWPW